MSTFMKSVDHDQAGEKKFKFSRKPDPNAGKMKKCCKNATAEKNNDDWKWIFGVLAVVLIAAAGIMYA